MHRSLRSRKTTTHARSIAILIAECQKRYKRISCGKVALKREERTHCVERKIFILPSVHLTTIAQFNNRVIQLNLHRMLTNNSTKFLFIFAASFFNATSLCTFESGRIGVFMFLVANQDRWSPSRRLMYIRQNRNCRAPTATATTAIDI